MLSSWGLCFTLSHIATLHRECFRSVPPTDYYRCVSIKQTMKDPFLRVGVPISLSAIPPRNAVRRRGACSHRREARRGLSSPEVLSRLDLAPLHTETGSPDAGVPLPCVPDLARRYEFRLPH